MIIKNNNTKIEIKTTKTKSNIGLGEDDIWYNIKYKIENDEINLIGNKELVSYKELLFIKDKLNEFINGNIKKKENIKFIKNFFRLNVYKDILEINLINININDEIKNYKLSLDKDDVSNLILMLS